MLTRQSLGSRCFSHHSLRRPRRSVSWVVSQILYVISLSFLKYNYVSGTTDRVFGLLWNDLSGLGRGDMNIQAGSPAAPPDVDAGAMRDRADADGGLRAAGPTQFISFAIGNDQYGVDIMAVREIKGWSEITHLPKQPDYMRGVLNLRGAMVPIIDLRCRFGQGMTEATALHVVIVVQLGSRMVGLLADRVLDIISFEASQVQAVPRVTAASRADFLSGLVTVDGAMIALIDIANLLSDVADLSENKRATH
jgi:purine-binding chemotaxis protein CheW